MKNKLEYLSARLIDTIIKYYKFNLIINLLAIKVTLNLIEERKNTLKLKDRLLYKSIKYLQTSFNIKNNLFQL